MGFPCGSVGKESTCNVGDLGSNPGLGRFPGEGKGYPFQYSGLENSMDCIVHGVTKSWSRLSNFPSFLPDLVDLLKGADFLKLQCSPQTGFQVWLGSVVICP